ncbi:Bacterial type II secretion system protein F domain protein [Maioricimonas rarisocia]|uniref:Bacterial type II secretion system protein F domain protein n=1 Tax=Maioricimonas rarisocia TaxID=2528026 RepID=A0A517ZCW3_9PLAN|nr:type II secretion system F family protein [Maioricimonas rarisocia]QDU40292.1 Bacterial type II secretion system protein F domain protein [Maioricimonas rarisocia]
MTLDPTVISIAAFFGVTGLIMTAYLLFREFDSSSVEDRLDILAGRKPRTGDGEQVTKEALIKEGMEGLSGLLSRLADRFGALKLLFVQADSSMQPETFLLVSMGFGLVGVTMAMVARSPIPLYPVAGLMTGVLPLIWLLWRRKRRFKKFASQLPDAMELIARALRSGHSLASGLKVVVDEMPDPISTEFNAVYEEQNLGIPIEQALKNVFNRMPNMDYKFFATAVAIQRQSGGDLAEILDKIGHIIRERFKIMGQVQALTGEGRISGIVLMALPIALFFAVWHMNPDYVMLLFTDELGRKMVAVAAVLQILGAIAIKKIIAIKI